MGRKAGGIYINPRKFGGLAKPCMKETMTFLNCLSLNHNNDEKCVRQKEQLTACMDAQAGKNKNPFGSINYHLQRLNRGPICLIWYRSRGPHQGANSGEQDD